MGGPDMPCLMRPWGHLNYRDCGPKDAPVLVFANSLGTDLRMWLEVTDRLPAFRCISYDKRGHGLSAKPEGHWTIGDLADDLAALLDELQIARATVIGCSVGGMIAQSFALRHPGRARGLVLSNTAAQIGTADGWQARIDAVANGGLAAIADAILDRWFAPAFRASAQALPWRSLLCLSDAAGYIGICRVLAATDLRAQVTGLQLPVLMLAGSEDQATPAELVQQTAALIPGAKLVTLQGSGHIPAIDAPAATAHLIEDFAKELAP
jgi:3-oxoadipate enol-lactonase